MAGINSAWMEWRKLHGRLALIRYFEVFRLCMIHHFLVIHRYAAQNRYAAQQSTVKQSRMDGARGLI
jgi:hypothetical protein